MATMRCPLISAIARRRESGAVWQRSQAMSCPWLRHGGHRARMPITVQCPRCARCRLRSHTTLPRSACRCGRVRKACAHRCRAEFPVAPLAAEHGSAVTTIAARRRWPRPLSARGRLVATAQKNQPSMGLARMDSSTSMDIKLRYSMVVGFMSISPSDMVGNSSGNPPARQTPRLTASPRPSDAGCSC